MAGNIHEIGFAIAAHLSGNFLKTFAKANKVFQGVGDQLNKVNNELANVSGVVKLRNENAALKTSFENTKAELNRYREASRKAKNQDKELLAKIKEKKKELDNARKAIVANERSLATLEAKAGTTTKTLQALNRQHRELSRQSFSLGYQGKMSALSAQKTEVVGQMGTSFAGFMLAKDFAMSTLGAPVKQAMLVEDTMAEIRKVADDGTLKQMSELEGELRDMTLRIPKTFQELGAITAAAAQSGIVGKDNLLQFTEKASQMSVAFDMAADSAGEMMAKWKSGLNLDLGKVYELADIVNTMSNQNAATAKQIGGVIMRSGALAASAGLGEKELVALAGSLIGSGATEETAATGIEAIIREATKGGLMGEKQKDAFSYVGFSSSDLQKGMQKDATGTLLKVLENLKNKIPKEMHTMYLTAMFGDVGSKALAPLLKNTELLKKNIELATNPMAYANSMLKEFESRAATTSNAFVLMGNAVTTFASIAGKPLLDPIKEGAVWFIECAKSMAAWAEENKGFIRTMMTVGATIIGVAVATAAAKFAIVTTLYPILTLVQGYQALKHCVELYKLSQFAATVAANGFGAALKGLFMNPVGLAIAGIAALIYGGKLLYENWDTIKQKAAELWAWISDIFGKIGDAISGAWEKAKAFFGFGLKSTTVEVMTKQGNATAQVPAMANGGIVTGPTFALVGEGRESEAVLPLSKLGSMLGNRSSNSNVVVNLSVNVSGSSQDAYADVKRGISEGSANLKRELERLLNDQRRLSFA